MVVKKTIMMINCYTCQIMLVEWSTDQQTNQRTNQKSTQWS